MKTNNVIMFVVLAIVAVIVGFLLAGGNMFSIGNEDMDLRNPEIPTGSCDSTTTPNLTISTYDNENKGTSLTESTNLYRKIGDKVWKTFTAGTGFEVEALVEYEFLTGVTTSDQTDNAYGEYFTYVIPCKENPTLEKPLYNDEIETSLSATFFNENGDASSQTFTAGDELTVSMKLKSGSDEFFGNPNLEMPNVVVLKLNNSEWDKPNKLYLEDGTELKSVSVPQRYDGQASGYTEYAYELPSVSDVRIEVFMDLNADDTNAPGTDGIAYIYAGGYFIDDDSMRMVGVEDEEGVAVGTDAPDTLTLDFTA